MIQDVDETLRQLLASELKAVPDCPALTPEQIVFRSPCAIENDLARINLFLYDVHENTALREEPFRYVRPAAATLTPQAEGTPRATRKRPPTRLNLSYLVTVHAKSSREEHRLLTEALGAFLRYPTIPADNRSDSPDYRQGALKEAEGERLFLLVAQPEQPPHANIAQIWQAIGTPMRPALGLTVTVSYDPFQSQETPVVTSVLLGTGQGTGSDGPRRPLDLLRTWVSAAGVVVDAENKPLPGVLLAIEERTETTQTDARGFFYFLNLPEGQYTVTMRRRGYRQETIKIEALAGRMERVIPQIVMLQPDEALRVQMEAEREQAVQQNGPPEESERTITFSLTGRLRYANGQPSAYLPVRVGNSQTTTDAEGVYHFINLPPGDHRVVVDLAGRGEVEASLAGKEGKSTNLLMPVEQVSEATDRGEATHHTAQVPAAPAPRRRKD